MGGVSADQRAVSLPWLRPSDAALLALTDETPDRATILDCPGAVALALRYARPTPDPATLSLTPDHLGQPSILAAAATLLELANGQPPAWSEAPAAAAVLQLGRRTARVAGQVASESGLCSPDAAWAAGLLAPLGRYAALATHGPSSGPVDEAAVARRLAFRWRLPTPFTVTLSAPTLPPEDAVRLGGHAGLHHVVRTAARAAGALDGTVLASAADPAADPNLLARLLRATAAARQRGGAAVVADLERHVDALTALLAEARADFETAVRDAKLSALAEFAAGASHEINNPLAIISGNAQLLLAREGDPDRQRRLSAVVRAAGRVHDILVGARLFARPPVPVPTAVPLADLIRRECDALRPLAEERKVRLELGGVEADPVAAFGDANQLRQAVANLIRNGIEAVREGGEVRVVLEPIGNEVSVTVEDSGPGPKPDDVPHLFDPFFSGRHAGRGRGLGLSVAWQLARQNGGSVAYIPRAGGPTSFTLCLPMVASSPCRDTAEAELRSA